MKLSIRTSIRLALLLFTILIVSIIFITIRRTVTLRETNQEAVYSEEIRYQLQQLLLAVMENETGARGYVITGNESFLEPLYASERTLKAYSSQLGHRIQSDDIKSIFNDSLKPLISKRIVFSRLLIKTKMLQNADEARLLIASGVGKRYTDSIRRFGVRINALQNNHLQQKRKENEVALRHMNVFLFAMLFIIFMLLVLNLRWLVLHFKKQKELVLRSSEETRRLIMNASLDAIICVDDSNRIIFWNSQAEHLFGWSFDEVKEKPFHQTIIPTAYRKHAENGIMSYLFSRNAESLDHIVETTVVTRYGKEFPVEFFAINVTAENNNFTCAYIRDISERKELQQQLLKQEKKIARAITATAIDAQEKERNVIGQELHDNINQLLAGTKLLLQTIITSSEKHAKQINMCIDAIGQVINENRRIAHEMVTPFLSEEIFVELIHKIASNMLGIVGIEVDIQLNNFDESFLSEKQKLTLYRIVQEQCTNIIKHANATKVVFSLESTDESVQLTISDNGTGMRAEKATEGIGLKNIASRLSVYNGTMDIVTSPGNGFILSVELQLEDLYQGV
ncbi:PAS domain S-box protein [Lacibacter luteus]|uniref:PAS domain S-box protein n=1 Tax=Lacibacter luteus TaxID=2508719 RepID=A0A4Q1CJR8_9BACT|nr:CHASE3 domain-containing protein [Lacibacter luteus]RXK60860.1 PAS domain S-box protein [Lacibacter luteus]